MNKFYKPSGKFSFLFLLYLVLSIAVIIPIFSYLHALIFLYSPFVILTAILMVICVFLMMLICEFLCVDKGKLRNKPVATVAALLMGLWFSFLSVVFYSADGKIDIILKNSYSMFENPVPLLNSIEKAFDTGFVLSRMITQTSITVRGIWLIIIVCIGILIVELFFISAFRARAGEPFMEQQKRWSKAITLNFDFIPNKEEFLERINSEDIYFIDELVLQSEENKSHSIFKLYPMDTYYCLSVDNQKADKLDKDGEMKFISETVVENLIINRGVGDMIVQKKQNN